MVGVTYPEAKHELNISKTRLKITVCDGFNNSQSATNPPTTSTGDSVKIKASSTNHQHSVSSTFPSQGCSRSIHM